METHKAQVYLFDLTIFVKLDSLSFGSGYLCQGVI
jgi:hypothetical protein